jgi:hypothetical protein
MTMLNSVKKESNLYEFILYYYNLPITVLNHNKMTLETEMKLKLPLSLSKKDKFLSSTMLNSQMLQFNNSGIYIFVHSSGKFAIGSALSLKRRLVDHMSSFKGHRVMQKLRKFCALREKKMVELQN